MICEQWATIVVPFPFTDKAAAKRRPAVVISAPAFNESGHTVMAMVTTKSDVPWPGDVAIGDLSEAGLPQPCVVRWKVFTLDNRLILRIAGRLSAIDRQEAVASMNRHVMGPWPERQGCNPTRLEQPSAVRPTSPATPTTITARGPYDSIDSTLDWGCAPAWPRRSRTVADLHSSCIPA